MVANQFTKTFNEAKMHNITIKNIPDDLITAAKEEGRL